MEILTNMYLATKLCCLCVKRDKITTNAHNVDLDNIKIMDKLIFCIPEITYNISNHLVYICTVCHDYLNLLYKFKNTCMENYKHFLHFITELERSNTKGNVFKDLTISEPECSNLQTNLYLETDTEMSQQNNCIPEIRPIKEEKDDYNFTEEEKLFTDVQKKQETEENNCLTNQQYFNTSNSNTFHSSTHQTITNVTNDNNKTIAEKKVVRKSSTSNLTDIITQNECISDIKPIKEEKGDYNFAEDEKVIIDVQTDQETEQNNCSTDQETEQNNCSTDQQPNFGNSNTFDVNTYKTIAAVTNSNKKTIDKKNVKRRSTRSRLSNSTDPKKMYSCTICQRQFSRKDNLNIHQRLHTAVKPFSCNLCSKFFMHKNNLNVHLRTHTGEQPYICTICQQRFRHKSSLNNHMRIHTGERPYSCSICQRLFRSHNNLRAHKKVHTKEKGVTCSICKKIFFNASGLNSHLATHSNIKKGITCSICRKIFFNTNDLNSHLAAHSNVKKLDR